MSKILYGLIGAGGFGREVMPLLRHQVGTTHGPGGAELAFVVEDDHGRAAGAQDRTNGVRIICMTEFHTFPGKRYFNIAVANSEARERIARECQARGAHPVTIFAANALSLDGNEIGDGAVFCPYAMVTSNARIGRFFHANIYSYVAHDCVIGDFVTLAPQACCNGNVRIEDHAYIGTGAVIREGSRAKPLVIGRGAVVGMGAVVTKDVAPGATVVGNPARLLAKEERPR